METGYNKRGLQKSGRQKRTHSWPRSSRCKRSRVHIQPPAGIHKVPHPGTQLLKCWGSPVCAHPCLPRASLVAQGLKHLPGMREARVQSPGEGNGNPLQYSCLENPMEGGAWYATVHWVAKSWIWLSDFTFCPINFLKWKVYFTFFSIPLKFCSWYSGVLICFSLSALNRKSCVWIALYSISSSFFHFYLVKLAAYKWNPTKIYCLL